MTGGRPVYVAGTGLHPFGRFEDRTLTALGAHAVRAALGEAGIGRGGFDAAFCGCVYGGVASGHKVLTQLGLAGVPIVNVEAGCASGGAALALGAAAIASGRHESVLVFGLEKMSRGMIRSSFFEPWREEAGLAVTPGYFALRAQRLMRQSDVTADDLARVSVTSHAHGVHNPNAMYRKPLTVEEVLGSPLVCEPLRLLMLCSPNEGAAAVVLSVRPPAQGPAVRVAAAELRSHLAGNVLGEHTPLSGLVDDAMPTPTEMAAQAAYAAAGLGPADLDVVELQDTDAARAILSAEELGLCARGAGGRWVREGGGEMRSRTPVNPSGGLLSKGEPLGASALGQAVEIVWQLRGTCGARQVAGARVGLAHTVGRGANACVMIFRR
jgi:acetyl-CoA acetyltransferase